LYLHNLYYILSYILLQFQGRRKRRNATRCWRDKVGRTEVILSSTLIPLRIVANYTNFRKGTLHRNGRNRCKSEKVARAAAEKREVGKQKADLLEADRNASLTSLRLEVKLGKVS